MSQIGQNGEHVFEQLSSYIDSNLGVAEREQVRGHLEACADCRAEYDELKATQVMLRSMPVMVPPRVFTLTEEDVAVPVRNGFWQRFLSPRNTPRFATGSVLAFVLLVLVLVGNTVSAGSGNLGTMYFQAPSAVQSSGGESAASAYPTPDTRSYRYDHAPLPAAPPAQQEAEKQTLEESLLSNEAMAEPTATVGEDTDALESWSVEAGPAAPTTSTSTVSGLAPAATPLPGGMGGATQEATQTSLPTLGLSDTDTYGRVYTGTLNLYTTIPQTTPTQDVVTYSMVGEDSSSSANRGPDTVLVIEVLLAVLGVALGMAAVVSRRA